MGQSCFISYSRKDTAYVEQLAAHLESEGVGAWFDSHIEYSTQWWQQIVERIRGCSALVVVMSPALEESEWVAKEVLLARREEKPVFPLLLDGLGYPLLIDVQHVDVTDRSMPPERFTEQLCRLQAESVNSRALGDDEFHPEGRPESADSLDQRGSDSPAEQISTLSAAPDSTTEEESDLLRCALDLDEIARKVEMAEETLAAADRAIAAGHGDLRTHLMRARALDDLGAIHEVEAACALVLALDANNVDALTLRARALSELGQDDRALAAVERALALHPDDRDALAVKAMIVIDDLDASIELADRGLAAHPDSALLHATKAFALLLAERPDEARGYVETALAQDRSMYVGQVAHALLLSFEGDHETAETIAGQLIAIFPRSPTMYSFRGIGRLLQERLDDAEDDFRKALEIAPELADVWGLLASLQALQNDYDGALESVEKCIELTPTNADRYDLKAKILLGKGHPILAAKAKLQASAMR